MPPVYPQSNATVAPMFTVLDQVAVNSERCASFYLDTVASMSNSAGLQGLNHHQGLARTHRLSDGSVYFFLTHSEVDSGEHGSLSVYRYGGALDDEHVLTSAPLTVAPMKQILMLNERHPADLVFLPEINGLDGGYLFVTEEYDGFRVAIYRWTPSADLVRLGYIRAKENGKGPNFLFIDRINDRYVLGIASDHWGGGVLYAAEARALFPTDEGGVMNIFAFNRLSRDIDFAFPVEGEPSQVKLVRDSTEAWYLLAFCSVPSDSPHGTDYIDVYPVSIHPFVLFPRVRRCHVVFRPGDTSFASTGTCHVERSGRLLVSSSYRWSENEGPDQSAYVSRVDELPAG